MSEEQDVSNGMASVLSRFRATREKIEKRSLGNRDGNTQPSGKASDSPDARGSKSKKRKTKDTENETADLEEDSLVESIQPIVAEGLQPLPQPEKKRERAVTLQLEWIVKPKYVSKDERASFQSLGVDAKLIKRLEELGIEQAFAVQKAVIPSVIASSKRAGPDPVPDILVNSFTGSGKTLAYCIPIVNYLLQRSSPHSYTRAVILVPTRPLQSQVINVLESLASGSSIKIMSLRADRSLRVESDLLAAQTPDVIVATPGRLVDHLASRPLLLENLRFLVIDEADRLLGQNFNDWTDVLTKAVPNAPGPVGMKKWKSPVQRMVFSATLTRDAGKLAALQIRTVPVLPEIIVVGDEEQSQEFTLPPGLRETAIRVRGEALKPVTLVDELVKHERTKRTIVFVRSNEAAARLATLISLVGSHVYSKTIATERCSGEQPVAERKRTLRRFADGEIGVLVVTDLIARGVDVQGVDLVVNYDLPLGAREYVHRVGRTARAGAVGDAWTLAVNKGEATFLRKTRQEMVSASEITELNSEVTDSPEYQQALKALELRVMGKSA